MRNFNKSLIAVALLAVALNASATNFGDTNNNQTYNQPSASANAGGGAGGAGGNGYGGAASATGGTAFGGSAAVGDIRNTANGGAGGSVLGSGNSSNTNLNTALGGAGGSAFQGQGQQQGQGQSQSNIGVNGQSQGIDSTIKNSVGTSTTTGTATSTSTTTGQSQSANNAGNSQSVGGQSVTINEADIPDDVTVRQAPTMIVSAPNATVSCYKTFGGSLSGILGGAGFSGGRIDEQCEFRETVRIAAAVDKDGAVNMLCLSQMYAAANSKKCAGVRPVFLFEGQAGRQYKANVAADAKK
jgi:hypothetical protein